MEEIRHRASTYIYGMGELIGNAGRYALQAFSPAPEYRPELSLAGKSCVITGGNAGIGFATAVAMMRRGCNIILACRNMQKAENAVQDLRDIQIREAGQAFATIEAMEVKLSSLKSVQSFCAAFNKRNEPLHFLILNAGVMGAESKRQLTEDGLEEHFQVNHLSHWLIACKLLREQRRRRREGSSGAAESTRVIITSSFMEMGGTVNLNDLQLEKGPYSGFRGYSTSKLENVLTAKHIHRKLYSDSAKDTAVAVHPGLVQTGLAHNWLEGRDIFGPLQIVTATMLRFLAPIILETPEAAARSLLFAAIAPASEVGGQYVAYEKVRRSSKASSDATLAEGLWQASMRLTGTKPEEDL